MRYILRHIPRQGVTAKGSYLDDAFTKSKPAVAVQILGTIKTLEAKTNLKIKISKCHVHAPDPKVADECRLLIASTEEISESTKKINIHSNMNLKFLNTPIGTDEFVATELNKKLEELKVKINAIAEMPFKMEAFTLLRTCWSQCRVVHLTRTLPPRQISQFLAEYDCALREGFETIINCGVDDEQWSVARMSSKYGGM